MRPPLRLAQRQRKASTTLGATAPPRARRLASTVTAQEKEQYLSSRATVPICHVSSRTCLGVGLGVGSGQG